MDSILNSVKKALGLTAEYEHFDPELIMYINSVFSVLTQLGVGPADGYTISSDDNVWSEFIADSKKLEMVKTYVYLSVRELFDPPSGSLLDAIGQLKKELEWRINVTVDPGEEEATP